MMSPSRATKRDTPGGRYYTIPGVGELPSVTHILSCIAKPALVTWAANTERELVMDAAADLYLDMVQVKPMSRAGYVTTLKARLGETRAHKRLNEQATNIGTQTHHLIEWSIRKALGQVVGPEPKVQQEALWAYMAFEDWAREHHVRPLLIEETVWSATHGYAGTMDLLAEVDGSPALVDFKTGKAIYSEAYLQSAAYQVALAEMGHGDPRAGYIVRLPKNVDDPEFEVAPVPPVSELFPTFQACLQVWKFWRNAEDESRRAWAARKAVAHG